jgi:hypothetical protein
MRPMGQHARPATNPRRFAGRSRTAVAVALLATVVSLAGVALSGLAWTTPTTQPRSTSSDSGARLTFSYRAAVPRSPAYQGTTVTAPDPLFRSLVHTVELRYAYTGRPGTIRLDTELSSASGWHTRIPLPRTARFDHVRTFVVHDDGVTYRYRVDVTPRSAPRLAPTPSAASLRRRLAPGPLDEPASRGER